MTTEQLRARTTGMEVVYIYHDAIDSAGHADDARVFPACEEAIAELQGLVRIIANRMNRHHVLITADHGFLYTYSPLRESDKGGAQDICRCGGGVQPPLRHPARGGQPVPR